MNAHADEIAGHTKEVAGIIAGNDELKAEGRAERHSAEAQVKVDDATEKVAAGIDSAQGHVDGWFQRFSRWVRRS